MRTPRFSIRSLLAAIAISGVGLAMLRSPLPIWASASHTVAMVAVVAGASSAILRRDSLRAYWVGFALFGATYLNMSDQMMTQPMLDLLYPYMAPRSPQATPTTPPVIAPPGTSVALVPPAGTSVESAFTSAYRVQAVTPVGSTGPTTFAWPESSPSSAWDFWMKPDRRLGEYFPPEFANYSSTSFRRIGHALLAILAAALGGAFVQRQYEANLRKEQSPEATP